MNKKAKFLGILFVALALILFTGAQLFASEAVKFPTKTITIICPYGAGGGTDALSRKIAELSKKYLGQEVIVVNKTGGGGAVGMGEGAKSKPGGYTVTMATVEVVLLPLAGLAPFSPYDFTPLLRVNFDPASLIVRTDSDWKTLDDFLNYAKQNPKKLIVMTSIFPTNFWLATTLVEEKGNVEFNKVTAQKGAADQIQNILGGHVNAITVTPAEAAPQVKSGNLRILAIASDKRDPNFPDVPTFKELGYNIEVGTWRGLMVPKNTPDDVVRVLEDAFTKAIMEPEYKDFIEKTGFGWGYLNSEDFSELLKVQTEGFKPVVEKYKK